MSKDSQEDEKAILAALDGIIRMQQTIRGGLDLCVDTGLVFLRTYYNMAARSMRCLLAMSPSHTALAAVPTSLS